MSALVDCREEFVATAKAFGVSAGVIKALKKKGWATHGVFAYCCRFVAGQGPDDDSLLQQLAKLQGKSEAEEPDAAEVPAFRRLHAEAWSLCAHVTHKKFDAKPNDPPRVLGIEERQGTRHGPAGGTDGPPDHRSSRACARSSGQGL